MTRAHAPNLPDAVRDGNRELARALYLRELERYHNQVNAQQNARIRSGSGAETQQSFKRLEQVYQVLQDPLVWHPSAVAGYDSTLLLDEILAVETARKRFAQHLAAPGCTHNLPGARQRLQQALQRIKREKFSQTEALLDFSLQQQEQQNAELLYGYLYERYVSLVIAGCEANDLHTRIDDAHQRVLAHANQQAQHKLEHFKRELTAIHATDQDLEKKRGRLLKHYESFVVYADAPLPVKKKAYRAVRNAWKHPTPAQQATSARQFTPAQQNTSPQSTAVAAIVIILFLSLGAIGLYLGAQHSMTGRVVTRLEQDATPFITLNLSFNTSDRLTYDAYATIRMVPLGEGITAETEVPLRVLLKDQLQRFDLRIGNFNIPAADGTPFSYTGKALAPQEDFTAAVYLGEFITPQPGRYLVTVTAQSNTTGRQVLFKATGSAVIARPEGTPSLTIIEQPNSSAAAERPLFFAVRSDAEQGFVIMDGVSNAMNPSSDGFNLPLPVRSGSHTYYVRVIKQGIEAVSQSRQVLVLRTDYDAPGLVLLNESVLATGPFQLYLRISGNDADVCQVGDVTSKCQDGVNSLVLDLPPGAHTLQVSVNDTSNNRNITTVSVYIANSTPRTFSQASFTDATGAWLLWGTTSPASQSITIDTVNATFPRRLTYRIIRLEGLQSQTDYTVSATSCFGSVCISPVEIDMATPASLTRPTITDVNCVHDGSSLCNDVTGELRDVVVRCVDSNDLDLVSALILDAQGNTLSEDSRSVNGPLAQARFSIREELPEGYSIAVQCRNIAGGRDFAAFGSAAVLNAQLNLSRPPLQTAGITCDSEDCDPSFGDDVHFRVSCPGADTASMMLSTPDGDMSLALEQAGVQFNSQPYHLARSGQYAINVSCSSKNTTITNLSTFNLPRGTLNITLLSPPSDIVVKDTFPFTARVACVGGECGNLTITLDPQAAITPPRQPPQPLPVWMIFLLSAITGAAVVAFSVRQPRLGIILLFIALGLAGQGLTGHVIATLEPGNGGSITLAFHENNSIPVGSRVEILLADQTGVLQLINKSILDFQDQVNASYGEVITDGSPWGFEDHVFTPADITLLLNDYLNLSLPPGIYTIAMEAYYNNGSWRRSLANASAPFSIGLAKGAVSTQPGAHPFWTPDQNPVTCELAGDHCDVTWEVNATSRGTYEFYLIVAGTQGQNVQEGAASVLSQRVNITVSRTAEDHLPPTILDLGNSTGQDIRITWRTDEQATTNVNWGRSTAMGSIEQGTRGKMHVFSLPRTVGLTWYNITSCDDQNNCITLGPFSVNAKPLTRPQVSLPPQAERALQKDQSFAYEVSSDSDLQDCRLYIDGNLTELTTEVRKGSRQVLRTTLQPGRYNWSVSCLDAAGMEANTSGVRTIFALQGFDGETTAIADVPTLDSVSNLRLEKLGNGRVRFKEPVNLSEGLDFESMVHLEHNRIEINTSAAPALNVSAELTLKDVTFANPLILMDNAPCPTDVCSQPWLIGNDLYFNVSHFTTFSATEQTNLTIWWSNSTDKWGASQVTFYANYTNVSSSQPVLGDGVYCQVRVNTTGDFGAWTNMTWDASNLYWRNTQTIDVDGQDQVLCDGTATGHARLNATDRFNLTAQGGVQSGVAPVVTLIRPDNGAVIAKNYTWLNFSASDPESDVYTLRVYVGNATDPIPNRLVYINKTNAAISAFNYNLTALPIQNGTGGPIMLLHFDNLSEMKENGTAVYDWASKNAVYGSCNQSGYGLICGTWNNTGKFAGNYAFNGSNQAWLLPLASNRMNNVSITIWANLETTSQKGAFVKVGSGNNGYGIGVGGDNFDGTGNDLIALYEGVAWYDSNVNIGTGWHHIAMVLNATDMLQLYIDGIIAASWQTGGGTTPTMQIRAGGYTADGPYLRFFQGRLDEFAMWNRTLTPEEIRQMARAPAGTYYWRTNATDTTGNSNTSTRSFVLGSTGSNGTGTCLALNNCVLGDACDITTSCDLYGRLRFTRFNISNSATVTVRPYDLRGYDPATGLANTSMGWNYTGLLDIEAQSIIIASGATLTANGSGYPLNASNTVGLGPGVGQYYSTQTTGGGAGHGGIGGIGDLNNKLVSTGGNSYGLAAAPTTLGSSGSGTGSQQGSGGGAIKLNATSVTISGSVQASGQPGIDRASGGSGGSIWIVAGALTGSGSLNASGGENQANANYGGGGSGGRIAVHTSSYAFTGSYVAYGGQGDSNSHAGQNGTVIVLDPATMDVLLPGTFTFSANEGINLSLLPKTDGVYQFRNLNITGTAVALSNWTNMTNGRGPTILTSGNTTILGALVADQRGYRASDTSASDGYGPGRGVYYSTWGRGGGAGHAGFGAAGDRDNEVPSAGGNIYGSALEPTQPGSSGAGVSVHVNTYAGGGGGVILLNVSERLVLQGSLSASGEPATSSTYGGGSGGSIWLIADSMDGNGNITAAGGNGGGSSSYGGPGAGGRIAIHYTTRYNFSGLFNTSAGAAYANTRGAMNGTVLVIQRSTGNAILPEHFIFDPLSGISKTLTPSTDGTYYFGELNISGVAWALTNWTNTTNGRGPVIMVSGNSTLLGRLLSDGLGYGRYDTSASDGYGPGGGMYSSTTGRGGGAGHAGYGGVGDKDNALTTLGGNIYGTPLEPTQPGSSGGGVHTHGNSYSGRGGGAFILNVTGRLIMDGALAADGQSATSTQYGGGAGGSIWLIADSVDGRGTITATGGRGGGSTSYGGSGSGGRIAIHYTTRYNFTGSFNTTANPGYPNTGGAMNGTVLVIQRTTADAILPEHFLFDALRGIDVTLAPATDGEYHFGTLNITGIAWALPNWTNPTDGKGPAIISTGDVTVTGQLLGDRTGYFNATTAATHGYGPSLAAYYVTSGRGGGAGHGGYGGNGDTSNPTVTKGGSMVGSPLRPVQPGSSGAGIGVHGSTAAGRGGGAIIINTTQTLTMAGNISMTAASAGASQYGGGAGGSIWLIADSVAGSGMLMASGGNGGASSGMGGGGAGGRIAIHYASSYGFTGTFNTTGGIASTNSWGGDNGTVIAINPATRDAFLPADFIFSATDGWDDTLQEDTTGRFSFGALTLRENATVWSYGNWTNTTNGRGVRIFASSIGVEDYARMLATGQGYRNETTAAAEGLGPGRGGYRGTSGAGGGAGHGAMALFGDTDSRLESPGGAIYGIAIEPTELGSSGGGTGIHSTNVAGRGGGAWYLNASGAIEVNGTIAADGLNGTYRYGGGAGGSVWLIAQTINGTGNVTADGGGSVGDSNYGGGGAGGRIAIHYSSGAAPLGIGVSATGGMGGGARPSDNGTVLIVNRQTSDAIIAGPFNLEATSGIDSALAPSTDGVYHFHNLNVTGSSVVVFMSNWTNRTNGRGPALVLSGNLTVDSAAMLTADRHGYFNMSTATMASAFPGGGNRSGSDGGGGGALGGVGGVGYTSEGNSNGGEPHGDIIRPTSLGGMGGGTAVHSSNYLGRGAGAMQLNVSGIARISGTLSASGQHATYRYGGGSGGSIWLIAGSVLGSGMINATGGNGGGDTGIGGGGSGGRIAIYSSNNSYTGSLLVEGGLGSGNSYPGQRGTIYLCTNLSGQCPGGVSPTLNSSYDINTTVNLSRTITAWSSSSMLWNDSSSNLSNVGYYTVGGLSASSPYQILNNSDLRLPVTTDGGGALATFNVSLALAASIQVEPKPNSAPWVSITAPANNSGTSSASVFFSCNATDDTSLANISLYIWNRTGLVHTNTTPIEGAGNATNWTVALPAAELYTWNCLGQDTGSAQNFSIYNYTFLFPGNITASGFTAPSSATVDTLFNVTANITCAGGYCHNITLTLQDLNASTWNASWAYRHQVNVSLSYGTGPRNYTVRLDLNATSIGSTFDWSDACTDLRILNSTMDGHLPYYIQSCDSSAQTAVVYVRVPDNLTTQGTILNLYYGSGNPVNVSDLNATFDTLGNWYEHWAYNDTADCSGPENWTRIHYDQGLWPIAADVQSDTWSGDNTDYRLRRPIYLPTVSGSVIHAVSDDGIWVYSGDGQLVGNAGGTSCHAGGTSNQDWNITKNLTVGVNVIGLWCSEAGGGENCQVTSWDVPGAYRMQNIPTPPSVSFLGATAEGAVSSETTQTPSYLVQGPRGTDNPATITLESGQVYQVNWTLNASGSIGDVMTYAVLANVTLLQQDGTYAVATVSTQTANVSAPVPDISIMGPGDLRGSNTPNVTFWYNVSTTAPNNCSLFINGIRNATTDSPSIDTPLSWSVINLPVGPLNWSVNCTADTEANSSVFSLTIFNQPHTYAGQTTNLSQVQDIRAVGNLTAEVPQTALIKWNEPVNLINGTNFALQVNMSPNQVALNSSGILLLNTSAQLTLFNLTFASAAIFHDGQACTATTCSDKIYSGGNLTFNVTGFSSYSAAEEANLTIWDDTDTLDINRNRNISFYANYTNITSGAFINASGTYCEIAFNLTGDWSSYEKMNMSTLVALYNYTRQFTQTGVYSYNILCNASVMGHAILNATDGLAVNNTAPWVVLHLPVNGSNVTLSHVRLNITANDTDGDVYLLQVWAGNASPYGIVFQNVTGGLQNISYNLTAVPVAPGEDDLVLLLHFDNLSNLGENGTRMVDSSGKGNNATCVQTGYGLHCPTYNNASKFAGGYAFNGINQSLVVADDDTLNMSRLSVAAWVWLDGNVSGTQARIVSKEETAAGRSGYVWGLGVFGVNYDSSGPGMNPVFFLGNGTHYVNATSGVNLSLHQWYHIAGVYNGTHQLLYVDGRLDLVRASLSLLANVSANVTIGGLNSSAYVFNGTIDEVAVWNRSLSSDEVLSLASLRNITYYWKANATDYTARNETDTWVFSVNTSINTAPTISGLVLNSSSGNNASSEDLSIYATVSDADGDVITNITDFRINGTSIALLYMPFDTPVTSVATDAVKDYSTNGYNGTIGGGDQSKAPSWVAGKVGGAYRFDGTGTSGTGQVINVSGSAAGNINSSFAVTFWIQPHNQTTGFVVSSWGNDGDNRTFSISQYDRYSFAVSSDGAGTAVTVNSSNLTALDTWQFISAVWDGTNISLYVNATLVESKPFAGPLHLNTEDTAVYLGSYEGVSHFMNATLDEVAIFNRSLTPEQISIMYQAGLAGVDWTTLDSTMTSMGEQWSAAVTPNDGTQDGATALSNSVTIVSTLSVALHRPLNNSNITLPWVQLNVTSNNTAGLPYLLQIWAGNASSYGLIFQNITTGHQNITYNLTALPVSPGDNDLILLQHFDNQSGLGESGTLFADSSGKGNDLSCTVCPNTTLGKFAGAYQFNSSQWLNASRSAINVSEAFTVSLWAMSTGIAESYLVSTATEGRGFNLYQNGAADPRHQWALTINTTDTGQVVIMSQNYTYGTWYHVAGIYDGSVLRLYQDGAMVASAAASGQLIYDVNEGVPRVGMRADGVGGWNGSIDELAVWNRSLSADEIHTLASLRNKTYRWKANVTDYATDNETDAWTFGAISPPPGIALEAPTSSAGSYARSFIQINVSANSSDLANITVRLYNTTGLVNESNSAASPFLINWTGLPDGTYTINASANTSEGAVNHTSSTSITLKTSAPAVWFENPTPTTGNYSQSYIDINVSATDDNLANITIRIYNTTGLVNESNSAASPFLVNWTGLPDGTYYINASANDTLGNNNDTLTRTIELDTVAPAVQFENPTPSTGNYSKSYIDINISASDGTAIVNITIRIYNSTDLINETNSATSPFLINWTGLPDGTYYINASANDSLGNNNDTLTRTIELDTVAPAVQFENPTPSTGNYSQSYIDVNVSASDSHLTNITIRLYNTTGLVNESNNAASPFLVNWTGLPDGTYYINASANDTLGNTNDTATRTIELDTAAPSISIQEPTTASGTQTDSYIQLNVSASDSHLANITIRLYNTTGLVNESNSDSSPFLNNWTGLPDGTYSINASANDTHGQVNDSATRVITINTVPPAIYFVPPTDDNQSTKNDLSISINASITGTISSVSIMFNQTNYSIIDQDLILLLNFDNISTLNEGAGSIHDASSYQTNGSIVGAASSTPGAHRNAIDLKGGYVDIPNETRFDTANNITVLHWFKIRTVSGWSRFVSKFGAGPSPYSGWETLVGGAESNQYCVNTNIGGVYSNTDACDPGTLVADTWYHGGFTYNGSVLTVYINGTIVDTWVASGGIAANNNNVRIGIWSGEETNALDGVVDEVMIWNRTLSPEEVKMMYYASFHANSSDQAFLRANITGLAYGTYNFSASTIDRNGLSNTTGTSTVQIVQPDTTKPAILFHNATPSTGNYSRSYIDINVSATDDNLANITIRIYNTTGLVNESNSDSSPFLINWTGLPDGTYYINASANDTLGNNNDTLTRTIELDTTAPTVSLESPYDDTQVNSTPVTFQYNVTDTGAITNCSLWIDGSIQGTNSSVSEGVAQTFTYAPAAGQHNWTVGCYDIVGNFQNGTARNISFYQDAGPPSVTAVSVSPVLQGYDVNVTIQATVTDDTAVDRAWVGVMQTDDAEANFSMYNVSDVWFANVSFWYNGTYPFTIYANDSSNNLNDTETGSFNLSAKVTIGLATDLGLYNGTQAINLSNLTVQNASFLSTNLTNTSFYLLLRTEQWTGSLWLPQDTLVSPLPHIQLNTSSNLSLAWLWPQYNASDLPGDGLYRVFLALQQLSTTILLDKNDQNMSVAANFTVDATAPIIHLVSPANNTQRTNSTVEFVYNVSDNSTVTNCSLFVNGILNQTNATIAKDVNQTFTTWLADQQYNWSVGCFDELGQLRNSSAYNITVTSNSAPVAQSLAILPAAPTRIDQLNCSFNISDADSDPVAVNITWFNNSARVTDYDFSYSGIVLGALYNNGNGSIPANVTTKGQIWSCNLTLSDGSVIAANMSANATIQNSPPVVALLWPQNENNTLTSRQPNFNWSAYDPDNESINFTLNITHQTYPNVVLEDIVNVTNSSIADRLEVDTWYNWTVEAYDGTNTTVTPLWNFSVASLLEVNLTITGVNFGLLAVGKEKNTTADSPAPFTVQNTGNVISDVKVRATSDLWATQPLNTSYFRFMSGNVSDVVSYNVSGSAMLFTNMSDQEVLVIKALNWSDGNNRAQIEMQVTVPWEEPPAVRQSTIVIAARQT